MHFSCVSFQRETFLLDLLLLELTIQLKRIRDAIVSDLPEVELERYYDTAPNRFLKLFAGISYLTYELGDRKVDNTSVYLKNLNNILNLNNPNYSAIIVNSNLSLIGVLSDI